MSYDQPDRSAKFTPSDHPNWVGRLFLFWPESVENVSFTRKDGTLDPTDIVTCDVAIIDLPDPENQGRPTFVKDAKVGGSALAPQLKKKVGKKVLGRLQQAPRNGEKTGAFFLAEWTPQDVQIAEQYEAAFPHVAYQSPSDNPPPANAWQAPQSGPSAPAQGQFPAQSWGGAQPAATPPPATGAAQSWGAPATPPPAPAAPPWPDGLREFLTARGYDTTKMDEQQARQIAATLPQ